MECSCILLPDDFCSLKNMDQSQKEVSPIKKQLEVALQSDSLFVELLCQNCLELKHLDKLQFDGSCTRALELVKEICNVDTRFLILRQFLQSQDECLPVQLLWAFEKEDLLHFPVYLAMNQGLIQELSQHLTDLLFLDCTMNIIVVSTLLKPTFVSVCLLDPLLGCSSEEFHSAFQMMIVDKIIRNVYKKRINFMTELIKQPFMLSKPVLCFVRQTLRHVILYSQNEEVLPSFTDAINEQIDHWNFRKTPQTITEFIKQLLDCLLVEDVIKICNDCLNETDYQLNWKWLLIVISTLIVTNTASAEILKKSLDLWLKEAVLKKSKHRLGAAFLIFRQCFSENIPPFLSYASWFSLLDAYFDTSRESKFFIDFLSEIVPYEPSIYLKVHINKVPSVPAGAHGALSDYITLAKTRLADLNETTDYIGLFGEYKTSEREGRESDIARVVSHYKETGEILRTVIEASVFRRTYYERVFLADLLQVEVDRLSPRYKFIEKLHSIGKCPNAMFLDWIRRNDLAHHSRDETMDSYESISEF